MFLAMPHVNLLTWLCLAAAVVTYLLFLVRGGRNRCRKCGYYFELTVYEKYVVKNNSTKCGVCLEKETANIGVKSAT